MERLVARQDGLPYAEQQPLGGLKLKLEAGEPIPRDWATRQVAVENALKRFDVLIQEWREAFTEGYTEYGPGAADETGLAGQWADLYRKVMKLKRAFWEGDPSYLTRETEAEILRDMISHSFLALEMLSRKMTGGRTSG